MSVETEPRKVWRVAMPVRVAAACVASGFLVLAVCIVWPLLRGAPAAGYMQASLFFFGGAIVGFLYAFATSVAMTDDKLVVRNLGLVDWIPLQDIKAVEGGYSGLTITAHDGRVLRGRAVEEPNYALWLGRRTRSDRVVADIRAASRRAAEDAEGFVSR
ncbi:hypothetical protein [Streptomyces sp. NPDC052114]|uniref:hypothetical protein n=1 Tax=unclassified Streptomyces TaxID=2593676 RepID=UPI00342CA2BB